ncbi:hypothetical protein AGENTSMITH_54 [Bacillus phage vB_BspM_AgentSmith]|nr:hypothetical protein AGENTSMITH_54 [Bacillus phage vB_BspM_AgentSmith]
MTKVELVQLLKDNLADNRLVAVKLFLEDLISRNTHGSGIGQYRMYTTTPSVVPGQEPTKNYITSVDDFLTKLDSEELTAEFMYGSFKATGRVTPPISTTPTNIVVELDHHSEEDNLYFRYWGGSTIKKQISFTLSYMNDNDKELPIKIVNVALG